MNQSLNRMIDHYILCKTGRGRQAESTDKMEKKEAHLHTRWNLGEIKSKIK